MCSFVFSARVANCCFGEDRNAVVVEVGLGAGRVYTGESLLGCPDTISLSILQYTFGKETAVPIRHVTAQVPSITEFVVTLDELHTVTF